MIEEISSTEEIENLYKSGTNAPYRKVEDGHGYYGVLIKDKTSGKVQCHICGKFFSSVGHHATSKHKLVGGEYKEKFGFPQNFPLCSKDVSEKYRVSMEKIKEESKNGKKIGETAKNKIWKKVKRHRNAFTFLSKQNEKNICPEQVYR